MRRTRRNQKTHLASMQLGPARVSAELLAALGPTLVAVIAGVNNVKAVTEWAEGTRKPAHATLNRLRTAHMVLGILRTREDVETIKAWFRGMNPFLEDKSPALTLREEPEAVLAAARAFADGLYGG